MSCIIGYVPRIGWATFLRTYPVEYSIFIVLVVDALLPQETNDICT